MATVSGMSDSSGPFLSTERGDWRSRWRGCTQRDTRSLYPVKGQCEPALSVDSSEGRARADRRDAGKADGPEMGREGQREANSQAEGSSRCLWWEHVFSKRSSTDGVLPFGGFMGFVVVHGRGGEERALSLFLDHLSLRCQRNIQVAVLMRMAACGAEIRT